WVGSHDRATCVMGALVRVHVVRGELLGDYEARRVHLSHDLQAALRHVTVEAPVVLVEVEGDAQDGVTPGVLVRGVEVHELVLVRQALALDAYAEDAVPVAAQVLLPCLTPLGALARQASHFTGDRWALPRAAVAVAVAISAAAELGLVERREAQRRDHGGVLPTSGGDRCTADEVEVGVVEVVRVEVVNDVLHAAVAGVAAEPPSLEDAGDGPEVELVAVVLAYLLPVVAHAVGMLAGAGEQHELHVAEREGGQYDDVSRLLVHLTGEGVRVGDPGGQTVWPGVDSVHFALRADLVQARLQRGRYVIGHGA